MGKYLDLVIYGLNFFPSIKNIDDIKEVFRGSVEDVTGEMKENLEPLLTLQ